MGVPLPDRRNRLVAALLGVSVLALTCPGWAVEGIAVVDYQAIFDSFEGTADAQRTLDRELKDWDQEAKEMRDQIASWRMRSRGSG